MENQNFKEILILVDTRLLLKLRFLKLQYTKKDGTKYCETIFIPWAEPFSRITNRLVNHAIKILHATKCVSSTAKLTGLDWHTVLNIMKNTVKNNLKKDKAQPALRLAIA